MNETRQDLGLESPPQGEHGQPQQRRDLSAMIVIVMVALAGALMVASASSGKISQYMMTGKKAPAIALEVLPMTPPQPGAVQLRSPEYMSPREHMGKVVLLDFWATWCPPCREQMPVIERLHQDASLKEQLMVLSINTDDPDPSRERKVRAFMTHHKYEMPTLLDDGSGAIAFEVESIPTIVLLDPSGAVHHIHSGVHSEEELRALIEEAKR